VSDVVNLPGYVAESQLDRVLPNCNIKLDDLVETQYGADNSLRYRHVMFERTLAMDDDGTLALQRYASHRYADSDIQRELAIKVRVIALDKALARAPGRIANRNSIEADAVARRN